MRRKTICNKHIRKGKFYLHSDGQGGHPSLVYKKSDRKNMYFLIVFTSSGGPKRQKLKHSIEPPKIKNSYVHNTPKIAKRRDLGSKELQGLRINKEDKPLIELIKRKNDSQDHF